MPEVIEVALTSMFLNDKLFGKSIIGIKILGGRYSRHNLPGLSTLKGALPFKILRIDSKGKFMWFELKNHNNKKYYIMNTFGLEGEWGFNKSKHSGVAFELSNGKTLYFTDSRNFGTLIFTSMKSKLDSKLDMLGPDFLKEEFTNNEFYNRIKDYILTKTGSINTSRKNKKIVEVLMQQKNKSGIGSGLGNYLAVEILYKAAMSPHTTMLEIYNDKKLSNKLAKAIRYVVKKSFETADIGYLADLNDDMYVFIKNLRKDIKRNTRHMNNYHSKTKIGKTKFKFNVYRQKKDPKGNLIRAEKNIIKGRTTYWSPKVQK